MRSSKNMRQSQVTSTVKRSIDPYDKKSLKRMRLSQVTSTLKRSTDPYGKKCFRLSEE